MEAAFLMRRINLPSPPRTGRESRYEMSDFFFAKAISIFINNKTIRKNIYRQNIILNCHCIFKLAFTGEKLM